MFVCVWLQPVGKENETKEQIKALSQTHTWISTFFALSVRSLDQVTILIQNMNHSRLLHTSMRTDWGLIFWDAEACSQISHAYCDQQDQAKHQAPLKIPF